MTINDFAPADRVVRPYHHIDPGFINHRLCLSAYGRPLQETYEEHRKEGDDHWTRLANDHLLVELVLRISHHLGVRPYGEVIQAPEPGLMWCSTEMLEGTDVYDVERARNRILLPYETGWESYIEFHTRHFVADTGKLEQTETNQVAILAGIRRVTDEEVVSAPVIMGAPSFDHGANRDYGIDLAWYGWEWYQVLPEDIDEFRRISEIAANDRDWVEVMRDIPEAAVKEAFAEILGDLTKADWGGEQDDHFSGHVTVQGRRTSGTFLLKGPARFREMTPEMLGTRADQIYRLSTTPAELLVVQHCHQIGAAVRATLRAFSVAPHHPRQYCLIDGKDTYRILRAYGYV